MRMIGRIKRKPLARYFALTLVWSWGWWSLYYILMLAGVPAGIAPRLMGILLIRFVAGRAGCEHASRRWPHAPSAGMCWPCLLPRS